MKIVRWFMYTLMTVIVLLLAVLAFVFFDYRRFLQTPMITAGSDKLLTVNAGDSIYSLSKSFPEKNIELAAQSPFSKQLGRYYFRYLATSSGQASQLKIGDYRLKAGMTAPDLLAALVSGDTIVHKIQFLEGKTFKQLRQVLQSHPDLDHTLLFVPDKDVMKLLGEKKITHPEGMFFPDTYQFPNRTKDIDILKQAYQLMQKNLAEAWEARDKTTMLKTPYELLILASIIEKETGYEGERRKIAGVFHRRLAKGMRLQTDPTVIYGMGERYKGKIYKSDLTRDTPYNTYTRKNLPPTPIAMPSKASLMAAGRPDKGKALYFVANGSGGHTFSETYKAHLKAVEDYRKQQK